MQLVTSRQAVCQGHSQAKRSELSWVSTCPMGGRQAKRVPRAQPLTSCHMVRLPWQSSWDPGQERH